MKDIKKVAEKLQKTTEDKQFWVIKDLSTSELISLAEYLQIPLKPIFIAAVLQMKRTRICYWTGY